MTPQQMRMRYTGADPTPNHTSPSPNLFILCLEKFGNAFRSKDDSKGICILGFGCEN